MRNFAVSGIVWGTPQLAQEAPSAVTEVVSEKEDIVAVDMHLSRTVESKRVKIYQVYSSKGHIRRLGCGCELVIVRPRSYFRRGLEKRWTLERESITCRHKTTHSPVEMGVFRNRSSQLDVNSTARFLDLISCQVLTEAREYRLLVLKLNRLIDQVKSITF
jgi:hypothetical protein